MSQFPVGFEKIAGVWASPQHKTTSYTDGDKVENYLMSVLSATGDVTSDSEELISHIVDWPSRYHLSSERANLLRGLEIREDATILELGCGCGAITRYLGDNGNSVIAIEGSLRRAQIARERCRDLGKVDIIASNFDSVSFDQKFDIVTLIGVLEYAPAFWTCGGDPFIGTLKLAVDHLKEDGILVVAIENQYGIKYFSGCREDHLSTFFSGIQGYPDSGVRTFGRRQLEMMLAECGLHHLDLILPFPDYKVPNALINAAFASAEKATEYNLVDWCRAPYQDYSGERANLFNDHLALAGLAENGMLSECSNSFLFIARRISEGPNSSITSPSWVAKRFNVARRLSCRTTTSLEGGQIRKTCAGGLSAVECGAVKHELHPEKPFLPYAKSLSFLMEGSLLRTKEPLREFGRLVKMWTDFVFSHVDARTGHLPPEFLDCVPDNLLLLPSGELRYVDREWLWMEGLTPGHVIVRGLLGFWSANRDWVERAFFPGSYTLLDFVNLSLSSSGISADRVLLEKVLYLEDEFQRCVAVKPATYSVYLDMTFDSKANSHDLERLVRGIAPATTSVPIDAAVREFETLIRERIAKVMRPDVQGNCELNSWGCAKSYDILVPVYNAFEHVERCLQSLVRHTDQKHRIIMLDDASTDDRVLPMMQDFALRYPNISVIGSKVNRGFVGNMNFGFSLAERDVVILNSDTEVTSCWLERMDRCLLSSPRVGIVSPLSNNATILSIPDMTRDNELPPGVSAGDMAQIVANYSERLYPRIPTAVGFCMMIKKEVLDAIGGFDTVFGAGYGEECDFCMKAWRTGFEVVCCDDAFVRHYGKASFGADDAANEQRRKNQEFFNKLWPNYEKAVLSYCLDNPLRRLQEKVDSALSFIPGESRPHVLHVLHTFGSKGGTEGHTLDIATGLRDAFRSTAIFPGALAEWTDAVTRRYSDFLRGCAVNVRNCLSHRTVNRHFADILNEDAERVFRDFLLGGHYEIVHFQHLLGWSSLLLPLIAKAVGKKVVLSLHDHFYLCPEFNLVDTSMTRCGKKKCDAFDVDCVKCMSAKSDKIEDLQSYMFHRALLVQKVLESADVLVAPSEYIKTRFADAFGDTVSSKTLVIPHGTPSMEARPSAISSGPLRVAYLGSFAERKGSRVFLEAGRVLRDHPVQLTVFGPAVEADVQIMDSYNINYCGAYDPNNLPSLLSGVDVVVIPSIVDETFCLTLNEALSLGVPVVASAVGAMTERVVDGWNGYLFPCGDAVALANILKRLAFDRDELNTLTQNVLNVSIKTTAQNVDEYGLLYKALLSAETPVPSSFMRYLDTPERAPEYDWSKLAFSPSILPATDAESAPVGKYGIALKLKREGQYAEAISLLEELYGDGDLGVAVDLGDCKANEGDIDAARQWYSVALASGVMLSTAYVGLGVLALIEGNAKQAIALFGSALDNDPVNSKALRGIAAAHEVSGDISDSLDALHRAVMADPEDINAVADVVRISYVSGDFALACECLEMYLQYHPGDVDMLFTYSGILHMMGADAEAEGKLEIVLLLSPEYPGATDLLSLITSRKDTM